MADEVYVNYDFDACTVVSGTEHYTSPGSSEDIYDSRPEWKGTKYGYCWKLCPYSTQWGDKYAKNGTPQDGFYRVKKYIDTPEGKKIRHSLVRVPASDQTDHSLTGGRMRFHFRGSKVGFLCTDPACKYYLDTGKYFFET